METVHGKQSSHELLDAQAHIWDHIFHYVSSMSLKCALQLNIPDTIHKHGKPMSLTELSDALSINKAKSQYIHRLMRVLVQSKFFTIVNLSDGREGYWLNQYSRLLLNDASLSLRPFAQLLLDPVLSEPYVNMSTWLLNDDNTTAFEMTHGRSFWGQVEYMPRFGNLFNEGMASDARIVNEVLLKDLKHVFEGYESLVDVGGCMGTIAMAIGDAFPNMKCIVLDLPHVVAGLEGMANLSYVGGDMFEAIPTANLAVLKSILHSWNDEDSIKILKKCKTAIAKKKGGKVIIIDIVVDIDKESDTDKSMKDSQIYFDMAMMLYVTGKERTEKEWAELFKSAGFSSYKVNPALGVRSLIEVYP